MTAVVAIIVAALATGISVWLWWSNRNLRLELAAHQSSLVKTMQTEANAKTAEARNRAEAKQRKAVEKLNREVVRVDANGDLAGIFDRATGDDSD
jgi:uncharacterized protein HemX